MKEDAYTIIIQVAEDFSDAPDGTTDGMKFYREILKPTFEKALKSNKKLLIDFDSGYGYLTSFLVSCFTSFKKEYNTEVILKVCDFKSNEDFTLVEKIKDIITKSYFELSYLGRECKNRLADAEDSYQHYTMVEKDTMLATYALKDVYFYSSILALIERL